MQLQPVRWSSPDNRMHYDGWRCLHGAMELIVLPERGAKIVSLRHQPTAQEWLWLNPHLSWRPPAPTDSFVTQHDVGGWDECFPTVAPTRVNGHSWPDHGDLWWRPWQLEQSDQALRLACEGLTYRFARTIEPDGSAIRLRYEVANTGNVPFPYLWCAHPLLRADSPLQIRLADDPIVRLGNQSLLGAVGDSFTWPLVGTQRFDHVGADRRLAIKCFVEVKDGTVTVIRPDGLALTLRWSVEALPLLGLWINEGGWSGSGSAPYYNLGIEPANGAPDDLSVAISDWKWYRHLQPGDTHRWSLTVYIHSETRWHNM